MEFPPNPRGEKLWDSQEIRAAQASHAGTNFLFSNICISNFALLLYHLTVQSFDLILMMMVVIVVMVVITVTMKEKRRFV